MKRLLFSRAVARVYTQLNGGLSSCTLQRVVNNTLQAPRLRAGCALRGQRGRTASAAGLRFVHSVHARRRHGQPCHAASATLRLKGSHSSPSGRQLALMRGA